jgi:hypothetical protein
LDPESAIAIREAFLIEVYRQFEGSFALGPSARTGQEPLGLGRHLLFLKVGEKLSCLYLRKDAASSKDRTTDDNGSRSSKHGGIPSFQSMEKSREKGRVNI